MFYSNSISEITNTTQFEESRNITCKNNIKIQYVN